MVKLILKPIDQDDFEPVTLEKGETVLGRGNLLNCSDKKVSRTAATLELKENGDVILCSTHVNPVFYGNKEDDLKQLKKNKSIKLKNNEIFGLTQTSFRFQIQLEDIDLSTLKNGNSTELKNGNGENKETDDKKRWKYGKWKW